MVRAQKVAEKTSNVLRLQYPDLCKAEGKEASTVFSWTVKESFWSTAMNPKVSNPAQALNEYLQQFEVDPELFPKSPETDRSQPQNLFVLALDDCDNRKLFHFIPKMRMLWQSADEQPFYLLLIARGLDRQGSRR